MFNIKKFLLFILVSLVVANTYSQNFFSDISLPEASNVRSSGMGGNSLNDFSTYYSFWANPTASTLAGKKTLWPSTSVRISGPYAQIPSIMKDIKNDTFDVVNSLISLLSESSGLNIEADIHGPLYFGNIKKNFGWGIYNRTYAVIDIPTFTTSQIYGGEDFILRTGYGLPLNIWKFKLTVAGALNCIYTAKGVFQGQPTEFLTTIDFENLKDINIPCYSTFATTLDIGATFSFDQYIFLSGVFQNSAGIAITNEYIDTLALSALYSLLKPTIDLFPDWKLPVGIGFYIPLKKITKSTVTSCYLSFDCDDLLAFIANSPLKRNRILDLSTGIEIGLLKTYFLRFGINECYPSVGLGLQLGNLKLDFSVYGKELGFEPGTRSQINSAFSLALYY